MMLPGMTWIFFFSLVTLAYCDWRVQLGDWNRSMVTRTSVIDGTHARVGMPFSLLYSNEDQWNKHNYSWYAPHPHCKLTTKSKYKSKVVCLKRGIFPFGIQEVKYQGSEAEEEDIELLKSRSIYIHGTYYCFQWIVDIQPTQSDRKKKLEIIIGKYQEDTVEQLYTWSSKFYQLGEKPKVTAIGSGNISTIEYVNVTYVANQSAWLVDVEMAESQYSINIEISPTDDIYAFGCFIESKKIEVTRVKYSNITYSNITYSNITAAISMIMPNSLLPDQLIQDPHDPHVFIYARNKTLYLNDGFELINEDDAHQVDDIILLKDHIVYIKEGHYHVISATGQHLDLGRLDWEKIYSNRNIPQGLSSPCKRTSQQSCDILFAVSETNELQKVEVSVSDHYVMDVIPIPFCSENHNCSIVHIEVNLATDIARILVNNNTKQLVIDYDLSTDKWLTSSILNVSLFNVSLLEFRFVPADTLETILFSRDEIYQLQDDGVIKQMHVCDDGVIKQIYVCDNILIVLLSSGYALYYQYGLVDFYKIFLGRDLHIYAIGDTFYRLSLNGSLLESEQIAMVIELDAATGHIQPSVLDFNVTFQGVIYHNDKAYIDKIDIIKVIVEMIHISEQNCTVKVIKHKLSGIVVSKESEDKLERNSLKKISEVYSVKLENSTSVSTRRATVSFAPYNYNGFAASQLKPKTLFIEIGCPPGRVLKLLAKHQNSTGDLSTQTGPCKHYLADELFMGVGGNSFCHRVEVSNEAGNKNIEITLRMYNNDTFVRNIPSPIDVSYQIVGDAACPPAAAPRRTYTLIEGSSNDVSVETMDSTVSVHDLQMKKPGCYMVKVQSQFASHCMLVSYLEIIVPHPNILFILRWAAIVFEMVVILVILMVSFIRFQKRTMKEQEEEIEEQKRQAELKYLSTLKHYQEQMCIGAPTDPIQRAIGRRRNSSMARTSTCMKYPEGSLRSNIDVPSMLKPVPSIVEEDDEEEEDSD